MLGEDSGFELLTQTWEEAERSIHEADFIALPCGSLEQHSLHLPLSVDSLRGDALTRRLVETAPEYDLSIQMLPTLWLGYSEHHMSYSGTVTVSADTYIRMIVEIGESLSRHGARRFLPINYHGGNTEPLKLAADQLQREHDFPTYVVNWTDYIRDDLKERFGDEWGHAGDHETSAMEHLFPSLVREEKKVKQTRRGRFDTRRCAYFDELTEQGGLGDPTEADPAFFADLIPKANERLLEALLDDIDEATD